MHSSTSLLEFSLSYKMDPQQENNGFGPLTKPRGKAAVYVITAWFVIVLSGALHVKFAHSSGKKESRDEIHFLLFGSALLILSLVLSEVVRRVCLVKEEIRHKQSRYKGSWKMVFTSTFTFRYGRTVLMVGITSLLILSYILYEHCNTFCRSEYAILFSLNCFLAPQVLFLVGLQEISHVELSQINENNNKNVADGLAWGYYFGYLKMVLPILDDRIGQSEYRYQITKKKLFILIPKSCYIYDQIEDADPRIKLAGSLTLMERNRGGVSKRTYKTSVHRIEMPRPDGGTDEYHVVLEYAVSLRSLYDMSQQAECGMSRQERDEQVILFIRKLKEILDGSEECRGTYELVAVSGEKNEIADVLVRMHHDANLQLDEEGEANGPSTSKIKLV